MIHFFFFLIHMKMHKVKMFNYLKWSRVPPGMRGLVLGTCNSPVMGVFSNNLSTFPPWKATVRASCAGPRGLPDQPRRGRFGKQEQVSRGCGSKGGEAGPGLACLREESGHLYTLPSPGGKQSPQCREEKTEAQAQMGLRGGPCLPGWLKGLCGRDAVVTSSSLPDTAGAPVPCLPAFPSSQRGLLSPPEPPTPCFCS